MTNRLTNIPNFIPYEIYAGDTIIFKLENLHQDYANTSHTLTYFFRLDSNGSTNFTVDATNSGSDYLVTLTASATANYTPGKYNFIAYVTRTNDNARVTIDRGSIEVKPNLASSTAETRTHAKKMLDAIQSLLEGKATKDVASYSIAGRSLNKMSVSELLEWRNYYKAEYNRELSIERNENGDGSGNTIKIAFGDNSMGYYDHLKNRKYYR